MNRFDKSKIGLMLKSHKFKKVAMFMAKFWRKAKIVIIVVTIVAFWTILALAFLDDSDLLSSEECNVKGIKLHGDLVTYNSTSDEQGGISTSSESVINLVREAQKDESAKAILLEIDSPGGWTAPGGEIARELKRSSKPVVVLIRQMGASAAYEAASGAGWIIASENSDVGSIGATQSYLNYSAKNSQDGLTYIDLSSGKYKDTGDPDKSLSEDEKRLLMRDVNIVYENFIKEVAGNRRLDVEKVRQIADGSTMLGQMALENGLIDQIGDLFDAEQYLKDKIKEEPKICW